MFKTTLNQIIYQCRGTAAYINDMVCLLNACVPDVLQLKLCMLLIPTDLGCTFVLVDILPM